MQAKEYIDIVRQVAQELKEYAEALELSEESEPPDWDWSTYTLAAVTALDDAINEM